MLRWQQDCLAGAKKITVQRTAPYGHHEEADANICGALRACPKSKAPARSRPAWNYEMHGTVSFCVLSMEIKRCKIPALAF